jgi:hypothetical protein
MSIKFDIVIIGSGPAGLGAAFHLIENNPSLKIVILEKKDMSSGGLRNDCKQNYTYPIGFPLNIWKQPDALRLLETVKRHLAPEFLPRQSYNVYFKRAEKIGVQLVDVRQTHIGTDRAVALIADLVNKLNKGGVEIRTNCEAGIIDNSQKTISLSGSGQVIQYKKLIVAPGRAGFNYLKSAMERLDVPYIDNMVDIGIRIEARIENYNIANDYYDPKFLFPNRVRTFCTNSGAAYVIKEKYDTFYSANGHSLSISNPPNGLVNFAMLKTIRLTDPITSGHDFAKILGEAAMAIAGNNLLMQRIGDFRSDKRSDDKTFNLDLYDFQPSLEVTAGDISLAAPAKIMRDIWKALKQLDSIVPGILHPSTIMYYPEIKTYATKPRFIDDHFQVAPDVYMAGDGAGTSRGITAAWASGILAAEGILKS